MSALKSHLLFTFSNRRSLAAFCLAGSLLSSISLSLAQQPVVDSAHVQTGLPRNAVIATFGVGLWSEGIAISPDNKTIYATNPAGQYLDVIDATTYQIKGSANIGYSTLSPVLSPDGKVLYVPTFAGIALVDTTEPTYPLITILKSGTEPLGLALSPDGKTLYVCNYGSPEVEQPGSVTAFDTSNYASTAIPVNGYPFELLFTKNGSQVDVLNMGGEGVLQFINTVSTKISQSTGAGGQIFIPSGMTSDLAGATLYITDYENYVSVCNASDGRVIKKILAVPDQLSAISLGQPALTHDGRYLYIPYCIDNNTQKDLNQVAMIGVETGKIVGTPITVGNDPLWTQISPDGKTLYVCNYHSGTVSVIDITPQ